MNDQIKTEQPNETQISPSELNDRLYICPDCNGDGKETCHNPDHGLISALSFHDIGRIGCPVCGHNEKYKVRNGGECETCEGEKLVTLAIAIEFIKSMDYDIEPQTPNSNSATPKETLL